MTSATLAEKATPQSGLFQTFLMRYATVATVATSIVVGISGVMLFFHVGEGYVKGAHEWIGMAFFVAALLHALRHVKPITKLLPKTRSKIIIAVVALVSLGFIVAPILNPNGGNPFKQFVKVSQNAPISSLAPVVGMSQEALVKKLQGAGVQNVQLEQSLREISQASGVEMHELFGALVRK
ncbi:DUF4405 domain-containing protein [Terasakiella sp. SH-1]|uniref:DUF4405 domain-containing protein n=1 Tax=Terasakiella sp. SH-1 TaxID=2560057 RepID=UPI0010734C9E|nr:DUF4405 domain-containing protein [Terasakiella sp. SH-1]